LSELQERLQQALADRYRVERELGQGGMAIVFLAHDLKHDRQVALKVLRPVLAAAVGAERFLREIRIEARLQHPHILPLYDSGQAGDLLYYVMPHVEGESLRALLSSRRQLTVEQARRIARELADALSYAHAHGVVHRDIKPENVLLSGGHAMVTDFGVAKAVDAATGDSTITAIGMALGTPSYMAPEQATADPALDHRADLYALGVVTYEMLTGRTPFVGVSREQVLSAHLNTAPQPVAELRADCPEDLARIVMRCLEKSPVARPQRAEDVIRWLDGLETSGATPADAARHSRTRRRLLAAGAAALVLLGVAGVAVVPAGTRATLFTLLERRQAALSSRRVLVAPFVNQTGDTSLDALGALASDWIGQGLSGVFGAEVVDSRTALGTQKLVQHIPWPLRARDAARAMAQEVGAGTLVSGTIYGEGDTLIFLTTITDVLRGRLVRGLAPVRASRARPSRALAELQRRVAGSLAQVNEATGGTIIGSLAEPPSLEAYEEVYRGMEAYFRQDDSAQFAHLDRAARLDSTYTTPLVFLAFAHAYHFQYATADSVLRRAERLSDRLVPAERALVDHLEAVIRGDREQALRAAERFTTLMPGSQESPLLLASVALSEQEPRLAITALARVDPDRGLNLVTPAYWMYQALAAAQLGDWSRMLAMARAGRRRFPDYPKLHELTAWALARLGQVREMERAIADLPAERDPMLDQARLAVQMWGELRAGGHREEADRLLRRYAGLCGAVATDSSREARFVCAQVFWRAGRIGEGHAIFAALAARDTGVARLRDLAGVGVTSARLGDREGALQAERRIAAAALHYGRGVPKMLQAEVAAALGEPDRSVELLRQGLALGLGLETLGGALLGNPDLEPLQGYAPFTELLRPTT
jgi:hypothetical protein